MPRMTVCSHLHCTKLVPVRQGKCEEHGRPAWQNPSQHTLQRPPDWDRTRMACLRRDGYKCRWILPGGVRCNASARIADHIQPVAEGGSWLLGNLQSLCDPHNEIKTAEDNARMRERRRRGARSES